MRKRRDEGGGELLVIHWQQILAQPLPDKGPMKTWPQQKGADGQ